MFPSMSPDDGISFPPQIFCKIPLHLCCGGKRHGVEVFVELGQESNSVFFDERGRFEAAFMVREAFLWRQSGHSDVDGWLHGVTFWVQKPDFAHSAHGVVEQDNVDIMVILRFRCGKLSKRAALQRQ